MAELDLTECEQEPIHLPGSVQMHAVLLTVTGGVVSHISDNASRLLPGAAGSWLSQPLAEVWDALGLRVDLIEAVSEIPSAPDSLFVKEQTRGGQTLNIRTHRWGGRVTWEFVEDGGNVAHGKVSSEDIFFGRDPGNPFRACQIAADHLAWLTGYDRVMVYRFHPDLTGEVVAEVCASDATPFLGLRYPASDIPAQARALFLANPLRIISDVQGVTAEILEAPGAGPLDCTHVLSRGVSPYHIEYLKNMGVGATFASSILVNGKLWGLAVGHHKGPRLCAPGLGGQIVAVCAQLARKVTFYEEQAADRDGRRAAQEKEAFEGVFAGASALTALRGLLFGRLSLQNLFAASGAAVWVGGGFAAVGSTPHESWLKRLYEWARAHVVPQDGSLVAETFATVPATLAEPDLPAAGFCIGAFGPPEAALIVVVFRPEITQEVFWGGDPTAVAIRDANQALRPRKSFSLWRQTVKGQPRAWEPGTQQRLTALMTCLAGEKETLPSARAAAFAKAIVSLISLNDRAPGQGRLELNASHEGIALLVEKQGNAKAHLHDANQGVYRMLGLDPVFDAGADVEKILSGIGVRVDALGEGQQRVNFWSPQYGLRVLATERKQALLVCHGSAQRRWDAIHFFDVTRDHRLSEAMSVAHEQRQQIELSQSAWLSNMTHEMRTPLGAVSGLAELIKDDPGLDEGERAELAGHIQDASKHLLTIVDRLLDLAEHEAGRLVLEDNESCDLVALARSSVAWLRVAAEDKNIELCDVVTDAPAYSVHADVSRLRQVIVNVLGNAIKYTPANGKVSCRVGRNASGMLFVEVEDTGVGIPAEKLGRVFDRFYRVKDESVAGQEGVGLGLAISKAIMELHGGAIQLTSTYGRGTVVRMLLPKWRRLEAAAA